MAISTRLFVGLLGGIFFAATLPAFGKPPPDQPGEKWTVVYIGASWLPAATRMFVEYLEEDLSAEVFYTQRNHTLVAPATRSLERGQWEIVREAQVVVVNISETTDVPGYCVDGVADTPFRTTPEESRRDVDAFLAALTKRANPDETIIRVTTHAALPHFKELWRENEVEEECLAGVIALNAEWSASAAKFRIPVVDIFAAWNGVDGARDAPREYFGEDGGHLSEAGARAAADLLRNAGYTPFD